MEIFGDLGGAGRDCTNRLKRLCPGKVCFVVQLKGNCKYTHALNFCLAGILLSVYQGREMGAAVHVQERIWAVY